MNGAATPTITGNFRPGLIDLRRWNYVAFGVIAMLLAILTLGPLAILILGSFMERIGYFVLGFTLEHWRLVLSDPVFVKALRTTLILATTAALVSPLMFSVIAYILVRTRLPGRNILDLMIWSAGAIPGILAGLGLLWVFIGTPGLSFLFGTIWALIIVVILQGKTTGVNIMKGMLVQVGADMEEAARVSGAGWLRTYFRIWLPLLMPSLILLAVMNFVSAAGATSSIILLASRDTMTLSLMALELSSSAISNREGREHPQHLHHSIYLHRRISGALLRPAPRRAPRHACGRRSGACDSLAVRSVVGGRHQYLVQARVHSFAQRRP